MTPKWLPAGPPGSSFGDFWGQKGATGLKFSAPGGLFLQISVFRYPRARLAPSRGPPQGPFWTSFLHFGMENATKMKPGCLSKSRKAQPRKQRQLHKSLRTRIPNKLYAVVFPSHFCLRSSHVPEFRVQGFGSRVCFHCVRAGGDTRSV